MNKDIFLLTGHMLNRKYVIQRVLGRGGTGITYLAHNKVLDIDVVIKEYYPAKKNVGVSHPRSGKVNAGIDKTVYVGNGQPKEDPQNIEDDEKPVIRSETDSNNINKMLSEARLLAKLDNTEGIVEVKDFFEENNTAYIVMDYVDGLTIDKYIAQYPIDAHGIITLMRPIFTAVKELHNKNIYHRDISPDNIVVSNSAMRAVLVDFGAAISLNGIKRIEKGVPYKKGYTPIEQLNVSSLNLGPWTDAYALGATLYRLLSGNELIPCIERTKDYKVPGLANVPLYISTAIMKAIEYEPQNRWQSIKEFESALYK